MMKRSDHIVLFFFTLIGIAAGEIKDLTISGDYRPLILFEKFGFTSAGVAYVTVSEVTFSSSVSSTDPSLFGFFLLSSSNLLQTLAFDSQQNPNANPNHRCILSSPYIRLLFTFRDLSHPPFNSYNNSFHVALPDDYNLFFANCEPESEVSMNVRTELYNSLPDGSRDYLSVGESQVPSVCFVFGLVFLAFLAIWLHSLRWSFLKPFLQDREKKLLMLVIPLQVVTNVASIVIGETGPFIQDWAFWVQVFFLVDLLCCCAILSPIVWSIRSLRETSKSDGKAAKNLAKLVLFRRFYLVLIGYLYFTRVVVFALRRILSYKYRWVSVAMEEGVSLAFYVLMFYLFRPKVKNAYFTLDDDEEAAAMVALKEGDFDI